ncbi:hypothetical protein CDD80_3552 [Ophiocordyceps camponoti-rufipedis]|uniref:Uncharacterized protein n=1 Tax=Ophiocordyceps camponoti-rufipedis TaxID=2004952 RepID=A0A2C5YW70_9HYPO|nr:hypothetical protein CDD80_3552 [Ophiocordyceps camponoti-rufipedis]
MRSDNNDGDSVTRDKELSIGHQLSELSPLISSPPLGHSLGGLGKGGRREQEMSKEGIDALASEDASSDGG